MQFQMQCDVVGLTYCKSTLSLIISAKGMMKTNAVLFIKLCIEAVGSVPVIVLDSPRFGFAVCLYGLSILPVNIILIHFAINNI